MSAVCRWLSLILICALLAGCGYVWRGQEGALSDSSILGAGDKTLRIGEIEQSTIYPWIPYMIRSQLRDDINARGLAIWKDSGQTDYTLTVRLPFFQIRSYGEMEHRTLLFSANIAMEFVVLDGHTNTEVWRSGLIYYNENYENMKEEESLKETLKRILRRCVDRLQQRF